MRRAVALAILLASCRQEAAPPRDSPGTQLEWAAARAGLIADPQGGTLTGAWALDTDRACVIPVSDRESRIGVLADYGVGQSCSASGTLHREGETLDLLLGTCRITARYDGERIVFPAEVPKECQRLCTGRATLDAFTVERISQSRSEAATLRAPGGRPLCALP